MRREGNVEHADSICRPEGRLPVNLDANTCLLGSRGASSFSTAVGPEGNREALAPHLLLAHAWRNLADLRLEETLASLAKFDAAVAPTAARRSYPMAEVTKAVLTLVMGGDEAVLRAALSVLGRRLSEFLLDLNPESMRVAERLSPRECSVLRSMSRGLSNKRIAQQLQIAPETVKTHVKGIFLKLGVQTRAHAVSTAAALGIL